VKFGFVAKHRGAWPVNLMCEALGVSRSGFYAWLVRPRSRRSLDDEVLGGQVRHSFVVSDRTYGARRVWHDVMAAGASLRPASHRAAHAGAGAASAAQAAWPAAGPR
jgi:putative transposase